MSRAPLEHIAYDGKASLSYNVEACGCADGSILPSSEASRQMKPEVRQLGAAAAPPAAAGCNSSITNTHSFVDGRLGSLAASPRKKSSAKHLHVLSIKTILAVLYGGEAM